MNARPRSNGAGGFQVSQGVQAFHDDAFTATFCRRDKTFSFTVKKLFTGRATRLQRMQMAALASLSVLLDGSVKQGLQRLPDVPITACYPRIDPHIYNN